MFGSLFPAHAARIRVNLCVWQTYPSCFLGLCGVRKTMCETIEKITLLSVYFFRILWIKKIFAGDLVFFKMQYLKKQGQQASSKILKHPDEVITRWRSYTIWWHASRRRTRRASWACVGWWWAACWSRRPTARSRSPPPRPRRTCTPTSQMSGEK